MWLLDFEVDEEDWLNCADEDFVPPRNAIHDLSDEEPLSKRAKRRQARRSRRQARQRSQRRKSRKAKAARPSSHSDPETDDDLDDRKDDGKNDTKKVDDQHSKGLAFYDKDSKKWHYSFPSQLTGTQAQSIAAELNKRIETLSNVTDDAPQNQTDDQAATPTRTSATFYDRVFQWADDLQKTIELDVEKTGKKTPKKD